MYYKLKFILLEKGISIEDVAKLLGVHRNTLSSKINGKSKFYIDELCEIRNRYFPTMTLDSLSEKKAV